MSATLETKNYQLPYFAEEDYTDWNAYNESMNKIDTQMKTTSDLAAGNGESVKELETAVQSNTASIGQFDARIGAVETANRNIQSAVDTINDTDKTQNQRLSALEADSDLTGELNTRLTSAESQISNNTQEINALKTGVQTNKTDISAQDYVITSLSKQQTTNTQDINNLKNDVESLTDLVGDSEVASNYYKDCYVRVFANDTNNSSNLVALPTCHLFYSSKNNVSAIYLEALITTSKTVGTFSNIYLNLAVPFSDISENLFNRTDNMYVIVTKTPDNTPSNTITTIPVIKITISKDTESTTNLNISLQSQIYVTNEMFSVIRLQLAGR